MFFFGKKKKEKKQEQAVPVVNKEELIAKASEKVTELESKTGQKVASNENYLPEKKKKAIRKKDSNE